MCVLPAPVPAPLIDEPHPSSNHHRSDHSPNTNAQGRSPQHVWSTGMAPSTRCHALHAQLQYTGVLPMTCADYRDGSLYRCPIPMHRGSPSDTGGVQDGSLNPLPRRRTGPLNLLSHCSGPVLSTEYLRPSPSLRKHGLSPSSGLHAIGVWIPCWSWTPRGQSPRPGPWISGYPRGHSP